MSAVVDGEQIAQGICQPEPDGSCIAVMTGCSAPRGEALHFRACSYSAPASLPFTALYEALQVRIKAIHTFPALLQSALPIKNASLTRFAIPEVLTALSKNIS